MHDIKLIPHIFSGGWNGFKTHQGDWSVGFVPSVGGRIMSLAVRGDEFLYVPPVVPLNFPAPGEDLAAFKRANGFPILGGDKTWPAPEYAWLAAVPPLDIDQGSYALASDAHSVTMTSPVCRETGLRVIRRLEFLSAGRLRLTEMFENAGTDSVRKGIWNVTQVPRPFDVYFPVAAEDIRSYHLQDPTLPGHQQVPEELSGWTRIAVRSGECFKFGIRLRQGCAVLVKDLPAGRLAWIRTFAVDAAGEYPHKSMAEVFNSAVWPYGEIEVHSPLYELFSGERAAMTQDWSLKLWPAETPVAKVLAAAGEILRPVID